MNHQTFEYYRFVQTTAIYFFRKEILYKVFVIEDFQKSILSLSPFPTRSRLETSNPYFSRFEFSTREGRRGGVKRKRRCHDRDYANWPRNLAKARFRRCLADHPSLLLPSHARLYNRIPVENIRQPVNVRLQLGITLRSPFGINLDAVEGNSLHEAEPSR